MEYRYYIADGKSLDTINEFIAKDKEAMERRVSFIEKWLGPGGKYFGCHEFIQGLVPEKPDQLGNLWRPCKQIGRGVYVPSGKTKEGKKLSFEMSTLGRPGFGFFSSLLGFPTQIIGKTIHYATFEKIGDLLIIKCPENGERFDPPDAKPIKRSEYWAMKEAEETAKAQAEPPVEISTMNFVGEEKRS